MSGARPITKKGRHANSTASFNLTDVTTPTQQKTAAIRSQDETGDSDTSTSREIAAARNDLQSLMTKAHAFCRVSGVASGDATLATKAPRRRGFMLKRMKRTAPILKSTPVLRVDRH